MRTVRQPSPPQGSYRFRADYDGVQFWSSQTNECALPGCTSATVTLPGGTGETTTTIDYTYDPLYRLTEADYSTGDSYHYAYDSVGNRLTQDSSVHGLSSSVSYNYDIANRLADVDGVPYVYDANGNLLNDGQNTYTYDSANRLTAVLGPSASSQYTYNEFGDRLSQNGIQYTLDLNAGLTQVLDDGTNNYTYGLGRISQQSGSTAEYFLGDALGSVRQLINNTGNVTLTNSYDPYGEVLSSAGSGSSTFAYTGEQQDASGLTYLRARYYNAADGRFMSRDTWGGDYNSPQSFNKWNYVQANPINLTDPTGNCPACIVGAIIGGAVGGFSANAYANYIYGLAEHGQCGCAGEQLKIAYPTRQSFVREVQRNGAVIGAVIGALPGFGDDAALAATLLVFSLSSGGIVLAAEKIAADPNNACAWVDLTVSILGAITSSKGLYNIGVTKGAIAPIHDIEAVGSSLRGFLNEMPNTKTAAEFEMLMGQRGMQYGVRYVKGPNGEEPVYSVTGYSPALEIRLHLEADKMINNFRVGLKLYPSANPLSATKVNPLDEPNLMSLDQQLKVIYGDPKNARPPSPGGWPGKYIDVFGNIYLELSGRINGFRTDGVHIHPR